MFDLGVNLKKLRHSKNWTQKRLSKLLNVSEASISKYESNIAAPPIETLRAYAALFKVSMDELLGVQAKETLSLCGLSDSQANVIRELVDTFKNGTADPDAAYSLIGKIIIEMHKQNNIFM